MRSFALVSLTLLLLVVGCSFAPEYRPPQMNLPEAYQGDGPWQAATPKDDIARGDWWTIFGDPELDRLEELALSGNPGLQVALARLQQARAALGVSRSGYYPQLDLNPGSVRSRTSADFTSSGEPEYSTVIDLPLDLAYEIDLWGRVRNTARAAEAAADAQTADYRTALLSLQVEVARSWFALRALDSELALLERTTALRRDNLKLVRSRFEAGESGKIDLSRAETELNSAEIEAREVARRRQLLQHSLAELVGQPASDFTIPSLPLDLAPPDIAPGVPTTLLERRPDVAAAERRMAAANADIGIARAAFFPSITLFGSAGFRSAEAADLFKSNNQTWAIGPNISLPIFKGGRNRANLKGAWAAWDEAVAGYRQTVLGAIGEVEDSLSNLHFYQAQAGLLQAAIKSSGQAAELSRKRYRAGLVSYLEVVDTERTMLQFQRQAARILGQQLETSTFLVKAIGGGWKQEIE